MGRIIENLLPKHSLLIRLPIPMARLFLLPRASLVQPAPGELPQGRNAARVIGRSGVI